MNIWGLLGRSHNRPASNDPSSIAGIVTDLRASSGLTNDGSGNVLEWADASGNGVSPGSSRQGRPPSITTVTKNGQPAIHFDPTRWSGQGDVLDVLTPPTVSGLAAAEFFVIGAGGSTPFGVSGMWNFGAGPSGYLIFGGTNYENFGSTGRPSGGTGLDVTGAGFGYNVRADASNLLTFLNGAAVINAGSNTVGWASVLTVGTNGLSQIDWYLNAIIGFDHILSSGDRSKVQAWALATFGVTL